jgi:hypothetical protein
LASLWEQPVPLSLQIFSYANIGMNLFKDKIQKLKLSISTSDIFMMFCQLIIQTLLPGFHYYIPKNLWKWIPKTASSASLLDIYYHFTLLLEKAIRVIRVSSYVQVWYPMQCSHIHIVVLSFYVQGEKEEISN